MRADAKGLTAVFVPDTHFPYVNASQLNSIFDYVSDHQPGIVVQLGDLYDLYCFGRWPINASAITPEEELIQARGGAEAFWRCISEIAPNAKRFQILGNHDDRILKLARTKAPQLEAVLNVLQFHSLWEFPGVVTTPDSREELILGGLDRGKDVWVQHGHRGKLGDHTKYNLYSTVCGHSHRGGVVQQRVRGESLWELNAGVVVDAGSFAVSYGEQKTHDMVPGFGVVDEYGPRFISL